MTAPPTADRIAPTVTISRKLAIRLNRLLELYAESGTYPQNYGTKEHPIGVPPPPDPEPDPTSADAWPDGAEPLQWL